MGAKHGTLEQRFWRYVQKTDSCWFWTGKLHTHGYGRMFTEMKNGKRVIVKAHRLAWQLANGPIPEGMGVLHRCDNPPCVNPDHLFLGTQADNNHDRYTKGRFTKPRAQLTESQVRDIRALYWECTEPLYTMKDLAKMYGLKSYQGIQDIVNFRNWKDVL